jgi:small subunit ribosomal protein S16
MSVKIRFSRVGRPHHAFYRLVATDRRAARDAKPIEILGAYNSLKMDKPEAIKVDRVKHWLSVGALPTDRVKFALKKSGVWEQVKPGAPTAK